MSDEFYFHVLTPEGRYVASIPVHEEPSWHAAACWAYLAAQDAERHDLERLHASLLYLETRYARHALLVGARR